MNINEMEKAKELTGEELVPASVVVNGEVEARAIPSALLKGTKGDKGDKGEKGDPGEPGSSYVTKEMWEGLVKRVSELENKAVTVDLDKTVEQNTQTEDTKTTK